MYCSIADLLLTKNFGRGLKKLLSWLMSGHQLLWILLRHCVLKQRAMRCPMRMQLWMSSPIRLHHPSPQKGRDSSKKTRYSYCLLVSMGQEKRQRLARLLLTLKHKDVRFCLVVPIRFAQRPLNSLRNGRVARRLKLSSANAVAILQACVTTRSSELKRSGAILFLLILLGACIHLTI